MIGIGASHFDQESKTLDLNCAAMLCTFEKVARRTVVHFEPMAAVMVL
jgi:hypothetical protein